MSDAPWLAMATAGLVCSWIVSPPSSTAGRASWAALVLGFLATGCLLAFDHRAVLVLALPLAALAAPLAVIRRHRAGSHEIPATFRRVSVAIFGALLFSLGVNVVVLNPQAIWAPPLLVAGGMLVAGLLPFHRPSTETLRAAPPDLRAPVVLMLGPALWIPLAHWAPAAAWRGPLTTLPVLAMWLGAFLVLARGDLPRLCSAALLFSAGQVGTAAIASLQTSLSAASAVTPPLLLVVLLLSKLERNSSTRDLSELGGLARAQPRFSIALVVATFWLVGTAAAPPLRMLIALAIQPRPSASVWGLLGDIWPVLIPHIIAVWGWTIVLRDLLVGPARSPLFPEALRDRVAMPQADRPLADLTLRELLALVGFVVIAVVT